MPVGNRRTVLGASKIAEKRKRVRRAKIILSIVGVALVLGISVWGAHREQFHISQVTVEGVEFVDAEKVETMIWNALEGKWLFLFPRVQSFLVNTDTLADMVLEAHPRMLAVRVERVGFTEIHIQIMERQSFAVWCPNRPSYDRGVRISDDCLHTDIEGYIFSEMVPVDHELLYVYGDHLLSGALGSSTASTSEDDVQDIDYIGQQIMPHELFVTTIEFANELHERGIAVWGIEIKNVSHFDVLLLDGPVLRFNPRQSLDRKIDDIFLAIDKRLEDGTKLETLEYIDARFPNKVVFKTVE